MYTEREYVLAHFQKHSLRCLPSIPSGFCSPEELVNHPKQHRLQNPRSSVHQSRSVDLSTPWILSWSTTNSDTFARCWKSLRTTSTPASYIRNPNSKKNVYVSKGSRYSFQVRFTIIRNRRSYNFQQASQRVQNYRKMSTGRRRRWRDIRAHNA